MVMGHVYDIRNKGERCKGLYAVLTVLPVYHGADRRCEQKSMRFICVETKYGKTSNTAIFIT